MSSPTSPRGMVLNASFILAREKRYRGARIEMRSKLQRQLKVLEVGEMYRGDKISDSTTTVIVARLKKCIGELNELLKEHGRVPRL
jgi:hypothetical protein